MHCSNYDENGYGDYVKETTTPSGGKISAQDPNGSSMNRQEIFTPQDRMQLVPKQYYTLVQRNGCHHIIKPLKKWCNKLKVLLMLWLISTLIKEKWLGNHVSSSILSFKKISLSLCRLLEKHVDQLIKNRKNIRVFFPMCGKALDMKW